MLARDYRQQFYFVCFLLAGIFLLAFVEHVYSQTKTQSPSSPASAAGQVVWVKGSVSAMGANNVSRTLERRGVVYPQDTIVTDASGSGEIVFSDNTLLSISPDSKVKIEQYQYTHGAAPSQDKYIVNIAKGGFRTITGAIAKSNPNSYQVNTPVATIGVRGTQWGINIISGKMYLKIEKGQIEIVTPKGKLILNKDTDKLYAAIDMANPVPMLVNAFPPGVFSSEPDLVPARSTLVTTNVTGGVSGGVLGPPVGPGGGSSGGGSSAPVSGFCIQ